jgi:hypothetical protein
MSQNEEILPALSGTWRTLSLSVFASMSVWALTLYPDAAVQGLVGIGWFRMFRNRIIDHELFAAFSLRVAHDLREAC